MPNDQLPQTTDIEESGPIMTALLHLIGLGDDTIRHGADILRQAGDGYGLTPAEEDAFKVEMALRNLADAIRRERPRPLGRKIP